MPLKSVAILPKKSIAPDAGQAVIDDYLRRWAAEFQKTMSKYPPAQPWRSRTPKSGPRAGGNRTGTYGEGWLTPPRYSKSSVEIDNPVPYAVVVGGSRRQSPGQARVLAARGWPSVQDVGPEVTKRILPRFAKFLTTTKD